MGVVPISDRGPRVSLILLAGALRGDHFPAFRFRLWCAFLDANLITDVESVLFIVRPVFLGLTNGFLEQLHGGVYVSDLVVAQGLFVEGPGIGVVWGAVGQIVLLWLGCKITVLVQQSCQRKG